MNTSVIPFDLTTDILIRAWLHEKLGRSGSVGTEKLYGRYMQELRSLLQGVGADLFSNPENVSVIIQGWAPKPIAVDGKTTLAPSTHNNRVAAISSFYEYAIRHGKCDRNPCDMVQRHSVQAFRGATPFSAAVVAAKLKEIDRTTLLGKRDYAMLAVSFTTGRRISAVAALSPSHIRQERLLGSPDTVRVTIDWPREKGGKQVRDTLSSAVAVVLVEYLDALAVAFPDMEIPTLWVSLARNGYKGSGLTSMGIRHIAEQRLGTTKFHALRHTFAAAMEANGATVSEIQHRLGHSSMATTGIYLSQLRSDNNPHADKLATSFGIE